MTDFEIMTFLGVMSLGTIELAMWAVLSFILGVFVLSASARMVEGKDAGLFTAGISMILSVVFGLVLIVLLAPLGIPYLGSILAFVVTLFIIQYMYNTSITNALGISLIYMLIMAVVSWAVAQIFVLGAATIGASTSTIGTVVWAIMIFATGAVAVWGAMEIFKKCTGSCRARPIGRLTGK